MKINWGTGIVIGMALFMGFIITLAVKMMNQKVDLVTKDYYEQGIAYEQQIESIKAANALSDKVYCETDYNSRQLRVSFPKDFIGKKTTGKIILFRPSDAKKDLSMPLLLDSSLQQGIALEKLSRGSWRIQIRWQCEGKDYYYEEDITI